MAHYVSPMLPVWTSSTTGRFFPLIGPVPFVRTVSVYGVLHVSGADVSSNLVFEPAAQFQSQDGVNWYDEVVVLSPIPLDPWSVGYGSPDKTVKSLDYTVVAGSIPATVSPNVRYGVVVALSSGSTRTFARLQLSIQTRE